MMMTIIAAEKNSRDEISQRQAIYYRAAFEGK